MRRSGEGTLSYGFNTWMLVPYPERIFRLQLEWKILTAQLYSLKKIELLYMYIYEKSDFIYYKFVFLASPSETVWSKVVKVQHLSWICS